MAHRFSISDSKSDGGDGDETSGDTVVRVLDHEVLRCFCGSDRSVRSILGSKLAMFLIEKFLLFSLTSRPSPFALPYDRMSTVLS
jgi:hypothetical protein